MSAMSAVMTIDGLIDALENVRARRGGNCPVVLFDAGDCSAGKNIYVNDDVIPVCDASGEPDFSQNGEWICCVGATLDEPYLLSYSEYDEWHEHQLEMELS